MKTGSYPPDSNEYEKTRYLICWLKNSQCFFFILNVLILSYALKFLHKVNLIFYLGKLFIIFIDYY